MDNMVEGLYYLVVYQGQRYVTCYSKGASIVCSGYNTFNHNWTNYQCLDSTLIDNDIILKENLREFNICFNAVNRTV